MLELLALIGFVLVGLAVCAVLGLVFGLLKLAFKVVLIPFSLAWGLFKLVAICCLILLALVLAPAILAVLLVAVPLVAVAAVVGLGWAVAT